MIDVDDFKRINDTHGHLVGDRVLKQLAALLRREVFKRDARALAEGHLPITVQPACRIDRDRQVRRGSTGPGDNLRANCRRRREHAADHLLCLPQHRRQH